jgi:hypothetical protein
MRAETLSGPAKFWGEYLIEPVHSGARLRKTGRIQLGGPLRMAAPLLNGVLQEALRHDMHRLKQLLERRIQ